MSSNLQDYQGQAKFGPETMGILLSGEMRYK